MSTRFSVARHHIISAVAVALVCALIGGWIGGITFAAIGMVAGAGAGFACARGHDAVWRRYFWGAFHWDEGASPEKRALIAARAREQEQRVKPHYERDISYLHELAQKNDAHHIHRFFHREAHIHRGLLSPYRALFTKNPYKAGKFSEAVEEIEFRDSMGASPLHYAARDNCAEAAEALLQHGANIEAKTEEGASPLHLAAFNGSVKAVEVLVKHSADINAISHFGETPLDLAVKGKRMHVLAPLLAHGAKSGDQEDWDSRLASYNELLKEMKFHSRYDPQLLLLMESESFQALEKEVDFFHRLCQRRRGG